jgi:uridylate kinase
MDSGSDGSTRRFRRLLLKLSGEVLMGPEPFGIHPETVDRLAGEVAEVRSLGVQLGLVIGGGNFFRGISTVGRQFERAQADTVGMLATVMNGLVFQDALGRAGVPARVMSALEMPRVAETFVRREAIAHLEAGRVVIFSAGTGHPYFSTDTGAVLRALEIGADAIVKGTKVDGVYSADPVTDPAATRYETIRYREVLDRGLRVMDAAAVALCMDNGLPLHVFNIRKPGNILALVRGGEIGTRVW